MWEGRARHHLFALEANTTWIGVEGAGWEIATPEDDDSTGPSAGVTGDGLVRSPMPGVVTVVAVTVGTQVAAGDVVAVVEAMKTEYSLAAPVDGRVSAVQARVGDQVAKDAPIIRIEPDGPSRDRDV
jgi:biotin carboxyl carrier protein